MTEIVIDVNGAARTVPAGATVEDLVALLGLRPQVVAVEIGGVLVPRSQRPGRRLEPGDRVEIVTLVGGG